MFTNLFAVCLLVENFENSIKFYSEVLGLEIREQNSKFADFNINGTSLAVFEKSEATAMLPKKYMNLGGGCVLAFEVWDVNNTCEVLKDKGVTIIEGPKVTPWGQEVAYFLDPEKNIWEISAKNGFYEGVIIDESITDKSLLLDVEILNVEIIKTTKRHKTPWVKQWSMYTCRISEKDIENFSEKISKALDAKRYWYADYKNSKYHYIVFSKKIFKVDMSDMQNYMPAVQYGLTLGIPKHQLKF